MPDHPTPGWGVCPGAPAGWEAPCGRPGPHGPHPMNQEPTQHSAPPPRA